MFFVDDAEMSEEEFEASRPKVQQDESTQVSAGKFINGVFTGIVEVFPYDSNQVRCKSNFTAGYTAVNNLVNTESWTFSDATFQKNFITDFADVLKLPFGVSHSCYWGFSTVLVNDDPMADGIMSEEEKLEELIMINNDYITNVFFNLGYMF